MLSATDLPEIDDGQGIRDAVTDLLTATAAVTTHADDIKRDWSRLGAVYHAPEQHLVLVAMDQPANDAYNLHLDGSLAANALNAYADRCDQLRSSRSLLIADLDELNGSLADTDAGDPRADMAYIHAMHGLELRAGSLRSDLAAAQRDCFDVLKKIGKPGYREQALEPVQALQFLIPEPPAGASPQAVNAWWMALPPATRAAYITEDPHRYGNLNGIPTVDRDKANNIMLDRDIAAGEKMFRDHGLEPPTSVKDVDDLKTWQLKEIGYYNGPFIFMKDERVQGALNRYKTALSSKKTMDSRGQAQTFLMTYDSGMYKNEGRVAIAFGNPDTAQNVAYSVPGLESRGSKMNQVGGDALNLYVESAKTNPAEETAVVAWQGYDAPEFTNVMSQGKAEAGAKLLTRDVSALQSTNHGDPRVTVVAHSYGSTTTGLALQREGLADHVDQVALIGSPGVGGDAENVRDLHLRDDQLFVGSASRDVVTTTYSELGHDPSMDTFGGTRFKAENVNRESALPWQFGDHSRYYDRGTHSESLYALAEVVTGRGDQLDDHGLVAEHRSQQPAPFQVDDPEWDRAPTQGHQH